jgi:hypothetical protein
MVRGLVIGCVLLLFVTAEAQAAARDEMLSGISRCAGIADNRTFLDCVYGAAQPMRAELGLPPASPAQIGLVPPKAGAATAMAQPASPRPSRGFVDKMLGSGVVKTPATAMASYFMDRAGLFTVTLKNGEVWRQNDDDGQLAHWRKPAANYIVTVVSGALGSSNLEVAGETISYKVTRLH